MRLKNRYIDELVAIRKEARTNRNWSLSDTIRDYLDTKSTFVFDTEEGQIVYHRRGYTRQALIDELKKITRAERMFDAWLFSIRNSTTPRLEITE